MYTIYTFHVHVYMYNNVLAFFMMLNQNEQNQALLTKPPKKLLNMIPGLPFCCRTTLILCAANIHPQSEYIQWT